MKNQITDVSATGRYRNKTIGCSIHSLRTTLSLRTWTDCLDASKDASYHRFILVVKSNSER